MLDCKLTNIEECFEHLFRRKDYVMPFCQFLCFVRVLPLFCFHSNQFMNSMKICLNFEVTVCLNSRSSSKATDINQEIPT